MASPWAWPYRGRHHQHPTLESLEYRVINLEERMSAIDDLVVQFTTAINTIASELQAEAASEDAAVAAKFQPFADRLTQLATNPTAQVPAASGAVAPGVATGTTGATGTGTGQSGATTSTDSAGGASTGSTGAGASTGSTGSAGGASTGGASDPNAPSTAS